jgi:hypothetical protein
MKKTITAALLSLLILSNGWAQDVTIAPAGNWNKVQDLPAKTNAIVELKHAGSVEGEFVRLTGDALVVKELERERTFPKDSVAAVRQMRPGSRAKKAAIAGGILFGIGFGLGYAAAPQLASPFQSMTMGTSSTPVIPFFKVVMTRRFPSGVLS